MRAPCGKLDVLPKLDRICGAGNRAVDAGAQAHDESKYPDWSGQWIKAPDGGPPRYDPSKPDGRGQQAPLKEQYRLVHEASMADQAAGGQGLYISSVKCIPMGMPFQMSIVFPFEFVVTEKTTFVLYEVMTSQTRRIYTDGRDWPVNSEPTFTGYFIGKWTTRRGPAATTLEVETCNMRVPCTFDQTGFRFTGWSGCHQGKDLSRQDQSEHPARRDDHDGQRADPPLDGDEELQSSPEGDLVGKQLHRGQ